MRALLDNPGPPQPEAWLSYGWWTLGEPTPIWHRNLLSIALFLEEETALDFAAREGAAARRLSGRELVERLGATHFEAVFIDPGSEPERVPFGPAFAGDLAQGLDPRQVTRVLPARSVAEIREFLAQQGSESAEHVLEYEGERLVARYGRYRFEPVQPLADPLDFGPGPSQILCAGLLLRRLDGLLENLRSAVADPANRDTALRLLDELTKLGAPQLPRTCLRSAAGAQFLRMRYDLLEKLEPIRAQLEATPTAPVELRLSSPVDLDDALCRPGPGQIDLLLDSEWWQWQAPGETGFVFSTEVRLARFLQQVESARQMALDPSARDAGGGWTYVPVLIWSSDFEAVEVARRPGREVFSSLQHCSRIRLNAGSGTQATELSASQVRQLLAGVDPRLGAQIYRARSLAEIDAFLGQHGVHVTERREVLWQGQPLLELRDRERSFLFYPVTLVQGEGELAPGRSELLCAGWWANVLRLALRHLGPDAPPEWRRERASWARELLKLVDPATGRIPESAVRTGADLAERPELLSREWLEEAVLRFSCGL